MNYQPPTKPVFHPVDRREMSHNHNQQHGMRPSRPSSPPTFQQLGSIDMRIDPIPIFPAFVGNDDSASTLQSDVPDERPHPFLASNNSNSRKLDGHDEVDVGDDRAAFSAAATNVGGGNAAKTHKRGDTFEPLPFRTSEDIVGIDDMAAKAYQSHYDTASRQGHVGGYQRPYAGQQIQMQVYPGYSSIDPARFDPSSPARMQAPIVSHAQVDDQQQRADTTNTSKGHHRKVPSFVTPLRGYDDAMIDDNKPTFTTNKYQHGGYHHNHHGHHGYYPPYHLWQHPYGHGHPQYQHGPYHQQQDHNHQGGIPHPPPAPPIFHPLANGHDEGVASKHTIKRRYFEDNRHDSFATPVPAPASVQAYHRPPLPGHDPFNRYNGRTGAKHHSDGQANPAHRRGPSIIFDNDEDWHQQSPTVLYRSWSAGGTSTTATCANARDDVDVRLRAPKKKSKKKAAIVKKKRKSKSNFTALADEEMPSLSSVDMTNDDNIRVNEDNEAEDANNCDDDIPLVTDLDLELPLEPLVNFQKTMKSSEATQKALEKWDKKMGLKRSHSKTMWDSDRSRQKLQNAILGIQRAKMRFMKDNNRSACTYEATQTLKPGVINEVDASGPSSQSSTLELCTPPANIDGAVPPPGVLKNTTELSSDSSILSESRDASNLAFFVSSPRKIANDEDHPTSAFILGSPTTGSNHTKTASASDILPLSPAEPSPARIVLSPKWAFKEV